MNREKDNTNLTAELFNEKLDTLLTRIEELKKAKVISNEFAEELQTFFIKKYFGRYMQRYISEYLANSAFSLLKNKTPKRSLSSTRFWNRVNEYAGFAKI